VEGSDPKGAEVEAMKRLLLLLVVVSVAGIPAWAQRTLYFSPEVPTDDPGGSGTTFLPWDVIGYKSPDYTPYTVLSLPLNTALDALHKLDKPGHWLLSVGSPTELPPSGGSFFLPEDVFVFDGSNYAMVFDGSAGGVPVGSNVDAVFLDTDDFGDLIVSFNVPTDLPTPSGIRTFAPADLARFAGGFFSHYFDASSAGSGIAPSDNVAGADESGGDPVLAMDIPSDLLPSTGPPTYLPGNLADWDGSSFNLFDTLVGWPVSSETAAFSCQANPGRVYHRVAYPFPITLGKSISVPGGMVINWFMSCSSGAEDYGIYEGTLGSWSSHKRVNCAGGSDLTETIIPQAADSYYLVVPHNVAEEGAYGADSAAAERPQPPNPADRCAVTRVVTRCP
jgi:hypothetical protein